MVIPTGLLQQPGQMHTFSVSCSGTKGVKGMQSPLAPIEGAPASTSAPWAESSLILSSQGGLLQNGA